jgi:hypothetical protein
LKRGNGKISNGAIGIIKGKTIPEKISCIVPFKKKTALAAKPDMYCAGRHMMALHTSNGNDIETKRNDALIIGVF